MTKVYYELICKVGERNMITKEIWCPPRKEFCKFIKICPLGFRKEPIVYVNKSEETT